MQKRHFLQSFDTVKKPSIDLTYEVNKIKQEYKLKLSEEVDKAKSDLIKKISHEYEEKFQKHSKEIEEESRKKILKITQDLTQQFHRQQDNVISCATKLNKFLIDYYVKKLQKKIIHSQIEETIHNALKQTTECHITINANTQTVNDLKNILSIEDKNILYNNSEELNTYEIMIQVDQVNNLISLDQIMNETKEILSALIDIE